ncbi:MAG TPA: glycoside hydrolase family 3 C-terminal domain-containing protein [Streptosporangiaceae bacterium]|nr:glycoside hydrolase family 3 C-terminal domain-containing protein [Streptosporangiaceae bacterium]
MIRRFPRNALAAGLLAVALPAFLAATGSPATGAPGQAASPRCPWLNQALPVSQRVGLLLPRMSLADKTALVAGAGASQQVIGTASTKAIPRLCVPAMSLEDGPNGVGDGVSGVTQLPAGVSLAATWDRSLATRYGAVIGSEERAKGTMVNLGPTVNIDRDPRWGRSFETYSEDPYLNAALVAPEIGGVQSQGEMSQVKHFAVYNQETNRNTSSDNAVVSERALHEIYLPAFWAATQRAKASSVMCSYATINNVSACQDADLLTTILGQRWGFPGFVTSDYGAQHATAASANAGLDQEMPGNAYYGTALRSAVAAGQVSVATLNQMVTRILTQMFRFGEFNHAPAGSARAEATTPAHQAVSTAVAEAGTVLLKNAPLKDALLKNRGRALPLRAGAVAGSVAGSVAVIGPAASAAPADAGGGSAYVTSPFQVTPLQGIRAAAGPRTPVRYAQGLPPDTSLAPVAGSALTPAFAGARPGQTYTGTLTAPQTGTYVLAVKSPGDRTILSLDGREILAVPGTAPTTTYSAGVSLRAGHRYTLQVAGAGPSARLTWATPSQLAPGIAKAVAAARAARTAVVVVSDDTESEAADRARLTLPSAQDELVSAVAAANPRTVVVIDAGAPVAMPWLSRVAAVVDAWYPGESNGTALGAVLFGKVNPGGHLPVTFPASLAQVPASTPAQFPGANGKVLYSEGLDVGYRYYDAKNETPLFPFGYGLSYTRFAYRDVTVTPGQVRNSVSGPGPTSCRCNGQSRRLVTVSATVTNTGRVAGSDVVQLYLGDPAVAGEPPRQLKAFRKVTLAPGQSQTVRFTLTGHDLSYWDDAAGGWVVPVGRFQIYVGDSSALAGLPLRAAFTVTSTLTGQEATALAMP